jgi:two-component system, OmpR family, sensor histidine kinase KdpD
MRNPARRSNAAPTRPKENKFLTRLQMGIKTSRNRHFLTSVVTVSLVSGLCYLFSDAIGYRSVALILLLTVSLLSMRLSLYPVLLAALLSALIWDYFFIPPRFTFHVNTYEDVLMLVMYFIVALVNGVMTARIRKFETIAREKEAKARAIALYDTLFDALAHELRTPIATILGASDTLMSPETALGEPTKNKLYREVNTAGERLHRLTDNLLNLSRLESGFVQPKLDWCDLSELVYTVVNRLNHTLQNHRSEIKIPEDLPLVKLDFGLMEQVLHNLLSNAAAYTPKGSTIVVEAHCTNSECIITVADSGPGFSKNELGQVFGKFYRAKNTGTGGIGLGLSIVKGFVAAHNGAVRVENKPGSGACFELRIPTEMNYLKAEDHEQPDHFGDRR